MLHCNTYRLRLLIAVKLGLGGGGDGNSVEEKEIKTQVEGNISRRPDGWQNCMNSSGQEVMKIERNMDTEENRRDKKKKKWGGKLNRVSKRNRNKLDRILMLLK